MVEEPEDWTGEEGAAEEAPVRRIDLVVEDGHPPERLDAYLARRIGEVQQEGEAELSRSRLKALIEEGRVTVAGRPETGPSRKVRGGDLLTLDLPAPRAAAPAAEAIPLTILHEDDDVVVVDKPAGLVVHPGPGNWTGTLVNALLHHCGARLSGIGGVLRPGIVHRLDKDTSGVMVVAKTDRAHKSLSAQFADHGRTGALERAYDAVVWGVPRQRTGTVDAPLGRDPRHRERMAVVKAGREAITHYAVLEAYGETIPPKTGTGRAAAKSGVPEALASLVECRLETGRTHQIRVHFAHLRHPLLGDPDYASGYATKLPKLAEASAEAAAALAALDRQALHARLLAFEHPRSHEVMAFESEWPADFARLVEALRAV